MIVRNPCVLWRQTLRGVVALAPDAEEPVVLAPPGDVAWLSLGEPILLADLVARMAAHFDADPSQIEEDLTVLVDELLAGGLVVVADAPREAAIS